MRCLKVAVLFAAAAALLAACGDDLIDVAGVPVSEVSDALADAETRMRTAATTENANVASDARCYLVYPSEDADQALDLLSCGPVLFEDSDADRPWMLFSTLFVPEVENLDVQVLRVSEMVERSSRLSGTERLWRPDGEEPGPVDIEVPLPPPVSAGFLTEIDEADLVDVALQPPEDPQLRGFGFTTSVMGRTTVPVLRAAQEVFVAPDGHELHVVQLTAGTGTISDQLDPDRHPPQARAIRVDGANRPLNRAGSVVVFAAPADARVELYVRDVLGTSHRYDIAAGKVVDSPSVYYRDVASQNVNESYLFPFTSYRRDGSVRFDGAFPHQLHVDRFRLAHQHPAAPERLAGEGNVWLFMDASVSGGLDWNTPISAERFVLHLPDGEKVEGTAFLPDAANAAAFLDYRPAWAVPENFEEGTLRITPGRGNQVGYSSSSVLDYGDLTVEIPVFIPYS